ncbi:FG-GAP and VCBS repeat-containing protein [Streptomyces sp. NPDC101150]|uniref:FG-GAP and VCBS repeat-containing protein n=1 Tax=Streptomyces sp. NPDC101150 TaxID=3366114 RepID=UPI00382D800F
MSGRISGRTRESVPSAASGTGDLHMGTARAIMSMACSGLLAMGLVGWQTGDAAASPPGLRADFNGDGYGDVVAASDGGAGRITVLYGAAGGLGGTRAVIGQESPGVPGHDEDGDGFGQALAAADFDGDGFGDLAVGIPSETVGTAPWAAGSVTVLWGGSSGLSAGSPLPTGAPDPEDRTARSARRSPPQTSPATGTRIWPSATRAGCGCSRARSPVPGRTVA